MKYNIEQGAVDKVAETIAKGIEQFFTTGTGIFFIVTAAILILGFMIISSQIGKITSNQRKIERILKEQRDIQNEILISMKIREEQHYQQYQQYQQNEYYQR